RGEINLFVRDAADLANLDGWIHEGLNHAVLGMATKSRLTVVDPEYNRRHTIAFSAEGIAGGEPVTVQVEGREITVVIPQRAIDELNAMSPEERDAFIGRSDHTREDIKLRKFPYDAAERLYHLALTQAIQERAIKLQAAKPPEPRFDTPEIRDFLSEVDRAGSWKFQGRLEAAQDE